MFRTETNHSNVTDHSEPFSLGANGSTSTPILTLKPEDPAGNAPGRPDPILVTRSSSSGHAFQKRNGGDSLKLSTTLSHEGSMPTSPIPSSSSTNHDVHIINNIDDFAIKGPIGYGSSAVVYSAVYLPLNLRVALKMIDLDMFERNQIDELRRETTLMALSKHPNILRVLGSFVHGSKLYIVTPYLAGGSCLDIMKTNFRDGLDELSIATILKQALEGLAYLHKNGHIHRDVKAGNLLMDEDGTVLLADFGVSSSLMDTGERGVRRTFVGTPCWMAPEVMEQAAYDYKADIWSFGITAIELATGHAPFAKLPPLKVLMMTLSSDPPTLSRETTKHKYSRVFKEMIDLCLNKDPSKRPTAEKLLQHPFFKQAKKKDYLVKTLLTDLPPLESRPHKKVPRRQVSITKTDEWDFQDDDESREEENANEEEANNNSHTSDNDCEQQQQQQQQQQQPPKQPKKHISFGDVVVRNPPQPYAGSSQIQNGEPAVTLPKKSRFVVEETTSRDPPEQLFMTPITRQNSGFSDSPMLVPADTEEQAFRKGRFSVNQLIKQSSGDHPSSSSVESTSSDRQLAKSSSQDNIAGTDRKSRFEVQLGDQAIASPQLLATVSSTSSNNSPALIYPIPLSRENSISSTGAPLTREGSVRIARHPAVDTKDGNKDAEPVAGESRKVGRFELTSGSSSSDATRATHSNTERPDGLHPYESPCSSLSAASSASSSVSHGQLFRFGADPAALPTFQTHMEELLKANEAQNRLLQDLWGMVSAYNGKSAPRPPVVQRVSSSDSQDSSHTKQDDRSHSSTTFEELMVTLETFETQLQTSMRENMVLQRENEALRKELEQLRQKGKNIN